MLVRVTFIDFFYHFLTNTILFRDTVSYRDISSSDMQYYYLVVSHIPTVHLCITYLYQFYV